MASAEHQTELDISLESFYKAIEDFSSYPNFVTGVSSATVSNSSDTSAQVEMEMEMIKKINYSIEVTKKLGEDSASLSWTLIDSDIFKKNNGSWSLKKISENKIAVTYSLDLDFKVSVPGFVLKGLVKKSLPKAVDDFFKEAKKRGN